MLLRLLAVLGLFAVSACALSPSHPQPTIRIGEPTAAASATAQSVCSGAIFTSVDPANPPAEWYECPPYPRLQQ